MNPWLTGRFVKHSNDGNIELGYDSKPTEEAVAGLDKIVEDDAVLGRYGYEGGASYSKLLQMAEKHLLKAGQELNLQQLWKFTIVKPSVLIVSMSHALGDGSSYNTLFQMLISGSIETVPIARVFGLPEKKENVLGGYEEAHLNDNWGLIMCFARGLITTKLITPLLPYFYDKATARFFLIKYDENMKAKVSLDETVSYISTNDIITSWFFKTANLGHSFMAVNRGRSPASEYGGELRRFVVLSDVGRCDTRINSQVTTPNETSHYR